MAEKFQNAAVEAASVGAVSVGGKARKISLLVLVFDEALRRDQARYDADGEGAAAEAEAVDPITGLVVAAAETIDRTHIALQPKAEDAAEHRKQPERRRAAAGTVQRHP